MQVLVKNLLLCVVNIPHAEAVVVDGHELGVGLVVERNLVGNIHTNCVTTDCLSGVNLI